jgi:predicted NBD/HSP70 family sugar kinase/predicted transcriptional regulator
LPLRLDDAEYPKDIAMTDSLSTKPGPTAEACDPPRHSGRTTQGKNPERSREHNRRVVLELLRRGGSLGRKELADMANISTQAVTNIIDDLLAEKLLLDLGRKRTLRGLPPIQYAINPDGAITIGLEIAVGSLTAAVLDLGGNPRSVEQIALPDMTASVVLTIIGDVVARLRVKYAAPLMGIGVVMPGPFEIEGLSGVGPTTLPDWSEVDAVEALTQTCGVPVFVDNDANAAAVAEMLFGKGQNVSHFCMLYFGAGIGMGAILADQPLRGAFGNAGEIGHIVVETNGLLCQCGQLGCLERYVSLHALTEAMTRDGVIPDSAALIRLYEDRDPAILAWLDQAAPYLARMISLLENIFDPQTMILGGKMPEAILEDLIARLKIPTSVANRRLRALPRVQRGHSNENTAALGAAALPFFNAITPQLHLPQDQASL